MCTTLGFVALAAAGLFVLFLLAVIVLIALARPLQALAGFALVLLGLPAYTVLAARRVIGARPREEQDR
jgi:hypothetical protein